METVVIVGGSGMIGVRIAQLLKKEGYLTLTLTRNQEKAATSGYAYWNPNKNIVDEKIKNADHIINLAGTGIADKRWSASRKKEIISSRLQSTRVLLQSLQKYNLFLKSYTNASAVGYYGNTKDQLLTEESDNGHDFLAEVCHQWETAALPISDFTERSIILRIGVVLSPEGGALAKMDTTLPYGISSILGSGSQYIPWIHIDDLSHIFLDALRNPEIKGIYNAVSPYPVRQKKFARTLKEVVNPRALLIPTPSLLLKLILGEMATIVLNSNKASAQKVIDMGFEFQYPLLEDALNDIYR